MKPFNLEEALAGKPVKLRNGGKAYVKYVLDSKYNTSYQLRGYIEYRSIPNGAISIEEYSWTLEGIDFIDEKSESDIIGMYEEPKRFINGIGVPEPLKENEIENGEYYWYISLMHDDNYIKGEIDKQVGVFQNLIRKGLVFKTKEGAKAMAKALLNYKVEVKNEWVD